MARDLCPPHEGVAVVGLGARFPGADNVSEFWNLLLTGGDAVTDVPADRFDVDAVHHPDSGMPGRTVSRFGGFVSDGFAFDASFFGISPVEARAVDPQQRLVLEVAWEALESAGIAPSSLAGRRVGVYVGIATAEYAEAGGEPTDIRDAAGARLRAAAAGRLSYALDLRGPSMTVDTACSSSLVAIHMARQSLLTGECDLAIAAGVNFINTATDAIVYSQAGMLSPTGRCRFGDAAADGFVRSEGAGVAILERVADATAAGDPILAVLRSSVVNNDGRGSGLLLHPAVDGQTSMIRQACRSARITPADVDYIEAHGTGTRVGDGVELRALAEVFADRGSERPLPIGSVKTNIGHTEAAAGIAGFIKAVLIARHRTVPASLHCTTANPVLDRTPLEVVTACQPLRPLGEVPVVGVSSFGITGTNAHVILEGPPQPSTPSQPGPTARPAVLVLSARSRRALSRLIRSYVDYLEGPGRSRRLDSICAAAARHRDHHRYRVWAVGADHADLARTLTDLAGQSPTRRGGFGEARGRRPHVAFLCSGQGPLWQGVAGDLLTTEPVFAAALDRCDQVFREQFGWSIRDRLTAEQVSAPSERAQPAIWAVQVALAALLRSWGVNPDHCLGHSMGEVAAATVAGALSPGDAAQVIGVRSTLLDTIAGAGAMLVVGLGAEDAADLVAACAPSVDIAACNAPTSTVLSGPPVAIARVAARLDRAGVLASPVEVDVASHSRQTDALLSELKDRLRGLRPVIAKVPLRSTVTTEPVNGAELRADYWAENLRRPVLLRQTIQGLLDDEEDCVFVELGPHPLLVSAVRETQKDAGAVPAAVTTLARGQDTRLAMAATLGQLFAVGASVDWEAFFADCEPVNDLPTYPWDREIHRRTARPPHSRRTRVVEAAIPPDATTATVAGARPIPPVVYLTAMAEVSRTIWPDAATKLTNVRLPAWVDRDRIGDAWLRITMVPGIRGDWTATVEVIESVAAVGTVVATATIVVTEAARDVGAETAVVDEALAQCGEYLSDAAFATVLAGREIVVDRGEPVHQKMWRTEHRAVACVRPEPVQSAAALFEICMRPLLAALPPDGPSTPIAFGSVEIGDHPAVAAAPLWSLAVIQIEDRDLVLGTVTVVSGTGQVVGQFRDIVLTTAAGTTKDCENNVPEVASCDPLLAVDPRPTLELIVAEAAAVLETAIDRIDPARSLPEHGLDSLMAVELARRLRHRLGGRGVAPSVWLSAAPITELARRVEAETELLLSSAQS
ncbi:type I polyketide synthase [Nocardia fluminea]|uniref:type I polyketide synthase n=1 Tax=Nocardia fluminea TaxID=134984 RepID=UPI0033CD7D27